jgi:hypothetical protein
MIPSKWRAWEMPLPRGSITVDTTGSGRLTRWYIAYQHEGEARDITSVAELAAAVADGGATAEQVARTDPIGLAILLCQLTDRPRQVPPGETLWPQLEGFGWPRADGEPRVIDGQLTLVVYSIPVPHLRLSRLWVNLATLDVREEVLADLPWPLVPAAV